MPFGIVCEYNPFHNGHLYQIKRIKEMSDEPIICVMSGNFTQRGEVAIADKYSRAKAAVEAGADLVLELPVPHCMASAEYFAASGVGILDRLGVDKLCFGSERANKEELIRIAQVASSPEFKNECEKQSREQGSAASYFELLERHSGVADIGSNDILAIEYTKAIIKNGYKMEIFPIKRQGSAYRETLLQVGEYPSATAIRESLFSGRCDKISEYVPSSTLEMIGREELASLENAGDAILLSLRLVQSSRVEVVISDSGLINRILSLSHDCKSFDELLKKLQTKKYTSAAIRRAILYILLDIKQSDLEAAPVYTVLLGANGRGREHLSSYRKKEKGIEIVTKPSSAPECRQTELLCRADALYTMCFENKKVSGEYLKRSPFIK